MLTLDDPVKVINIFQHLALDGIKVLLWQNINKSHRRICKHARIFSLNIKSNEMTFYPLHGDFSFSNGSYLYFYHLDRTIIFKATILYHSQFKVVIRLPEQLLIANSRVYERDEISMANKVIHYTLNPQKDSSLYHLFLNSKLLDVSSGGLSFKSNLTSIVKFNVGDKLWIKSPFNETSLVEGEIRYVTAVTLLQPVQAFLRVGVKLY